MTERNTATFEVDGPAAQQLARTVVSSLGMDAETVTDSEITVTFGDGQDTSVTVSGDGPLAGVLVAEMMSGVEWDDHTATSVSAAFTAGDDDPSADSPDDAVGEAVTPVVPLTGSAVGESAEFPDDHPGRLPANTKLHALGALLLEYRDVLDDEWANTDELSDFAGDEFTDSQVGSGLSQLFNTKNLLVRRQVQGASTRHYEYHPTKQLSEEVERLGDYDISAVRANAGDRWGGTTNNEDRASTSIEAPEGGSDMDRI